MKKRICGFPKMKNTCVFLSVCALFFLFPSCNDDDDKKGGGKQGFLSLKVSSDTQYVPASRAGYTDPENADEYMVYILQGSDTIQSFLYSEAPEELPLEAGTYQVKAAWGEDQPAAFESLYMEGTENFTVVEEEITSVTISPTPANALVVVNYDDELASVYPGGYFVDFYTRYNADNKLRYAQDETRPAHFRAGTDEKMNLEMQFSTAKNTYKFDDSFLFSARDSVVVTISLEPEGETPVNPTLTLTPSFHQFAAETTQSTTIRVTTNCDNFTYTSSGSWFSVSKGNGTLTVTPQQNTTSNARSGYIAVTAMKGNKSISAQVSLVQLAEQTGGGGTESAYIFGNPNVLQSDRFDSHVVTIQTNASDWEYEILDAPEWLTATPQNKTLVISSNSLNYTDEERTAQIELVATLDESTAKDTITVTQIVTVADPELSIWLEGAEVAEIPFTSDGGTQTITVNTNLSEWDVIIPQSANSWLTVTNVTGDSFTLTAQGISSEESREVVITIEAKAKNGDVLRNFPTVIQNGKGKPQLKVTIEVDNTILVDSVLTGYVLDSPLSNDPNLDCVGFESTTTFTIKEGEARSYFINVRTPQIIKTCHLKQFPEGALLYDCLDDEDVNKPIVCSMNSAGTLGVIYLDDFFNSLPVGNNQMFTLEVTDDSAASTPATVMIFINVEN